ncbi:CheR family methyltransferase [Desulfobacula phenolica]|nr:CheR family methyltransferase [Desulfobacula phenolica]
MMHYINKPLYSENETAISESSLSLISKFLSANMGLYFPKERWPDLRRGIVSACQEFDHKDPESFIQWLLSSSLTKSRIESLAIHLTIGETYFFRDKNVFNALETHILPKLMQARQKTGKCLRLWSAACSTGEEPYSLAILLSKMIPDLSDWNITICATDINPQFLKKALGGIYTKWSFRGTSERFKDTYFTKTKNGHYRLDPLIKKMVKFSYLNLMDNCYPSITNNTNAMDLIFCRNVLMYFPPEYVKKVISRIYRSNSKGGWFVVSPGEMPNQFHSKFNTVYCDGAIFYQKGSSQTSFKQDFKENPVFPIPENQPKNQLDYQNYFQQELIFLEKTDITDEIMPQPLKISPESPKSTEPDKSSSKQALQLFKKGEYTKAAELLRELLSNDQFNADAMTLLAQTYANKGDLAKAAQWCEKAIVTDKLNPSFHYLLSTIMAEMGRMEEAASALKNVLYLDYNFVLAYFSLGNINCRLGKLKESKKNFDNAISILSGMQTDDIVPESDGITAGRLMEIIKLTSGQEAANEQ